LGRPVLDKTGIRGGFDFTLDLEWTLDANGKRDPTGYPIFEAIQEQLGLKLESQKAPMEFFVIDHAEQPTAN
jgi:uncharacterized protein (TIGR03435 family)